MDGGINKMKIAVACSLSNSHIIFLDHFVKSVLKHNPKFNYDWLIFCRSTENLYKYSLTERNKKHLLSLYPKFKFIYVDMDNYIKYGKGDVIYYSIELFNQTKYDRIIFWGADMLCLKPLKTLFKFAEGVEGVAMSKEKRRGCWNNGSMIVGEKYLNKKTYNDLIQLNHNHIGYRKYFGHDQKIYNIYFSGAGSKHTIKKVHQRWNVMVSEIDFIGKADICIMHYFYKPTVDASRRHLTAWQIEQWEKYDDPDGRFSKIDD